MTERYRIDLGHSRFTVQAFAGGLLSFVAHSPTFAVRDFAGEIRLDPSTLAEMVITMTIRAESLELVDDVRAADHREIEERMRREVLETATYPEIRFEVNGVSATPSGEYRYRVRIGGLLALHGVTNRHVLDAELGLYTDGVRLTGESSLRLSDYRIAPVTALGGSIRLRDELRLAFDLVAWKEQQ